MKRIVIRDLNIDLLQMILKDMDIYVNGLRNTLA